MPQFSVIVPTRDRADSLRRCLDAFGRLAAPEGGFEVIIVDDGGQQPVEREILPKCLQPNGRILRTSSNLGPAAARNLGARAARGEYLSFTDDDCTPAHDWLTGLQEAFDEDPEAACGGPFVNANNHCRYASASHAILDVVYNYYNRDPKHARFLGTANFAVSAKQFAEIGGFNEAFRTSEDREFCRRWVLRGWRMIYVPGAVVEHRQKSGFGGFVRRHFHYGRGAYRFRALDVIDSATQVRLEPQSFYWRLLTYPFNCARWPRAVVLTGLVIVSQVASTLGFLAERFSTSKSTGGTQSSIGRN